jgi:hypothetical protein
LSMVARDERYKCERSAKDRNRTQQSVVCVLEL